jgi:ABC-type branched-subunit amino acid transport system substrate-binding protein
MKKRLLSLSLILMLVAILLVSACAQPAGPIKVGIAAEFTGWAAPFWPPVQEVIDMVIPLINQDPPLGRPLEVIYDDAEGTVEGNISVANYLGGQGVAFAVGYDSDGLWAAEDVIMRYGTPTFTQWAGTARLDKTEMGRRGLFYRYTTGDTIMFAMFGLYWRSELAPKGFTKVAILNDIGESSTSNAEVISRYLRKAGAQISYEIAFSQDETTFSRMLADAFATDPDAVFFIGSDEQGSVAFKQWWDSALSKDILWFVGDVWASGELLEPLLPAPGAFDGKMIGPNPATGAGLQAFVGTSYDVFIEEFQKVYGAGAQPGHGFAISEYDALIVGALAIEAAGDAAPEEVAKHIRAVSNPPGVKVYSYQDGINALREGKDIDFEGAASFVNVDDYGNVYPPTAIFMVVDGEWTQIKVYSPEEMQAFIAE